MPTTVYDQSMTVTLVHNDDLSYTCTIVADADGDDLAWTVTADAPSRALAISRAQDEARLQMRLEIDVP